MWIITLAWKNIWRNKSRTVITIAAIFFAVILSVLNSSLGKGVFDNMIKNMVSFYSGYIQVHKGGYWNEQVLDNSFQLTDTIQQLSQDDNINALAPRLESFALASSQDITKGCLVIGVDPEKENSITQLKNKVMKGSYFHAIDQSVLIGSGLAQRLELHLNDTVVLIGQGYHGATAAGKYKISGILKFGSPDLNDKVLYMPLLLAQELYGADSMITTCVLSLKKLATLNATANRLKTTLGNNYEVMTWEEIMPEVVQQMKTDTANKKIIQGILYILVSFGIFGTIIMMIVERKYEMGMLVAIGMKKIKLITLLSIESLLTVLTGCILGILTSIPIVYYLHKHPIKLSGNVAQVYERFGFEAIWPTSTDTSIFISQGVIVLIIGLVLSLYPVYTTIQLNPVTAMRR
jgi:putative ABC transport system permease protein